MAKKSLKKRIDDLVDALGGAEKPTLADIRSKLVMFASMAEALEDGQALAEKDARITALETELGDLKIALDVANGEIETFRAERKKQEEKEREIPPIQFKILKRLPSEHSGDWQPLNLIALALNIPVDEAEIHLDRLEKARLVVRRLNQYDAVVWHRSMKGNELVMAKRLAGEEEEQEKPKRDRYPDLAQAEQLVLLAVARENGITVEEITNRVNEAMPTVGNKPYANPGLVMLLLITLRGKKMVIDRKASGKWIAGLIGREYLAERGLR